mmetsp:Transcript_462/g.430  ORF Transcript_462/g.430 Transcript_462/m.430 type:complete len:80 (-) Transcript_462:1775-2014(-)
MFPLFDTTPFHIHSPAYHFYFKLYEAVWKMMGVMLILALIYFGIIEIFNHNNINSDRIWLVSGYVFLSIVLIRAITVYE